MNVLAGTTPSPTPAPAPSPTPEPTPTPTPAPTEDDPPEPLVGGESKEPATAEPEAFVPLTAEDITFPEDFTVHDEFRDDYLKIVNDQELSNKDRTQALTDLYVKAARMASEAGSQEFANQQKVMQDEVKADPTIGGDKLPATLSAVNGLVTEYGSDELVKEFAATGIGNSLRFITFLNKVAGVLTEGKPVTASAPTNQDSTAAERLFPSMKGK